MDQRHRGWLDSIMPTWAWCALLAVCIGVASLIGKALHPDAGKPYLPSLSKTAYLCDLDSYRQEMIRQGIEDVEEHGGDKFDEEATQKRVLAESDAELNRERLDDLAIAQNTYRNSGDIRELCPTQ